jgi:hypothetical protein
MGEGFYCSGGIELCMNNLQSFCMVMFLIYIHIQ